MNIEAQVCNLELAKRIKELGVKQESAFWWEQVKLAGKNEWAKQYELAFNNGSIPYSELHIVSAFTVAELGQMLPEAFLWDGVTQVGLSCAKYSGGWHVRYHSVKFQGKRSVNHLEDGKTEADARAKMLVFLLGSKLMREVILSR